jgi:hypothetical protein
MRQMERRRAASGRAQLRRPFGKVHGEASRGLGLDEISDIQG